MNKIPHVFLTRANRHIQKIIRYFDETLNRFGPVVFAAKQEQDEYYIFREVVLQPDMTDFILAMIIFYWFPTRK